MQIAPGSEFTPPAIGEGERQLVKLIRGSLIDMNYNGLFGKFAVLFTCLESFG